jgi:MFS transporter, DHA2 family, multidrug resistance protein
MGPEQSPRLVSRRTWIAVGGALIGCFMAVLDIIITNASLRDIQGSLSASVDEIAWVSTAYLVAEIIVIPMTGWLAQVFSLRYYLLVNSSLFVIFSVCCGLARDLHVMILFRALQGFTGGVLIPLAFQIILRLLPESKQPIGLALFGLTATFAPSVGPLIGGWLTENYGWPLIFYINIVPGILQIVALWYALDAEPLQLRLLRVGDWWGIATMAVGLGALQVVLEEGNRKDWFGSTLIVRLTVVAAVFLTTFVVIELIKREPLLHLRLLARRNFGLSSLVNVAFGFALYGSIYVLPAYLGIIQGYNSLQIGAVIVWMGLPQLVLMPLVARLLGRIDPRVLLAFGIGTFAASALMMAGMSPDTAYDQLRWPQLVRACGQPFVIVPLSVLATAGIAAGRETGSASALFNMMRNIGGSIGIALLATLLSQRERLHSLRIGESVSAYDLPVQHRMTEGIGYFVNRGADVWTANQRTLRALDGAIRRQAFLMAFNDCFYVIGMVLFIAGGAVVLLRRIESHGRGAAAH